MVLQFQQNVKQTSLTCSNILHIKVWTRKAPVWRDCIKKHKTTENLKQHKYDTKYNILF